MRRKSAKAETGAAPIRVLFSTDASLDITSIIAGYGATWAIECLFREAKQLLGSECDEGAVRLDAAPYAIEAVQKREPITAWIIDDRGVRKPFSWHEVVRSAEEQ